jgi:hypothetical protein
MFEPSVIHDLVNDAVTATGSVIGLVVALTGLFKVLHSKKKSGCGDGDLDVVAAMVKATGIQKKNLLRYLFTAFTH